MAPLDSATEYGRKGPRYREAWDTLVNGCDVPPSLDVFDHELKIARRAAPMLTVEGLARRLSQSYHRVSGFFGPEAEPT